MPGNRAGRRGRGILIAAPSSGAGKTTLTLALLRALKNRGTVAVSAKSGPDYIDPKFHEAASGSTCINLDAWAMDGATIRALAADRAGGSDCLIVEGAMGLFDGAANGRGSAADLAVLLGLPVVLIVDCAKQAHSVAALVHGFRTFRDDVRIAGVILNRVGSERHEAMLRAVLAPLQLPVLGAMPRAEALRLPERHLGLVQAQEHEALEAFLEEAATLCTQSLDLDAFAGLAGELIPPEPGPVKLPAPLGQKIAVARDVAFAFAYPHLLEHWKNAGAELSFFSPLADEAPVPEADAVFLPGGYPELHAARLASASAFKSGMTAAASSGKLIYGECGGYMTLGEGLIDAEGSRHGMLGLLPLETSFMTRKRHLGYRKVRARGGLPWVGELSAHEFHYASIVNEYGPDRLFEAEDAGGNAFGPMGLRSQNVMGSFAHVIASA